MKIGKFIGGLIAFMFGAGCQSSSHHAAQSSSAPPPTPQPTYTVELIPTPQLTPTSREGDKSNVVYSSNIVAVYVNSNGVSAGMTNTSAAGGGAATPRR